MQILRSEGKDKNFSFLWLLPVAFFLPNLSKDKSDWFEAILFFSKQLVVWASNTSGDNEWEKKRYRNLGGAYSKSPPPQVEVKIQFLQDQKRLLVGTEAFMAIYHMGTMERLKQVIQSAIFPSIKQNLLQNLILF